MPDNWFSHQRFVRLLTLYPLKLITYFRGDELKSHWNFWNCNQLQCLPRLGRWHTLVGTSNVSPRAIAWKPKVVMSISLTVSESIWKNQKWHQNPPTRSRFSNATTWECVGLKTWILDKKTIGKVYTEKKKTFLCPWDHNNMYTLPSLCRSDLSYLNY